MNSDDLGTINFAYYMIDQTHLKIVEIDPSQPYILYGEAYGSPLATTPLNGGVAFTFGGAANRRSLRGRCGVHDQCRQRRQRRRARHQ